MSDDDLHDAWAEVHAATLEGWFVGRPSEHPERGEWVMFAFDTRERPIVGKRAGEWTAVAPSELEVVRSMARCLRELGEGRWPKERRSQPRRRLPAPSPARVGGSDVPRPRGAGIPRVTLTR